ncbi:DNA repair protein RecN [Alteromonadaceae bacterium BrNp21-10]|nr:DNA repair protein RecN [Alteromonadaceae bacterium BrNp21-10]
MLTHLCVRDFAIVKAIDIELHAGMTAITGETGAGKSIAIDALGLCLGDRAEASMVRPGADKAEITAIFSLSKLDNAKQWLQQQELGQADDEECIIRRVISNEGRSRAFINGSAVPLQSLKGLGAYLVSIHGQHAHQQLLKPTQQQQLLDNFAKHHELMADVKSHYQQLHSLSKQFSELQASQSQRQARRQLLEYQVTELNDFALMENEFTDLELEYKRLSNGQALLEQSQRSLYQLYTGDEVNALSLIQSSTERLLELQDNDPRLAPITALLSEASIQVSEAANELRAYLDDLEIDPLRMQQVEERYSLAMELARKHHIKPEQLHHQHQQLLTEFKTLQSEDDQLMQIQQQIDEARELYSHTAKALSESRQHSALQLAEQIQLKIRKMNMPDAQFAIEVNFDSEQKVSAIGQDVIRFTVSTNPGMALDTLEKVASGGELSRIGLAVQTISSATNAIPTMIFDEVDTGISGPTASVVGSLLRQLGENCQVMCVTHLPQVAARANNQLFVTKFSDSKTTETHILELNKNERINELARLLAGDTLTESAIANAKELLACS